MLLRSTVGSSFQRVDFVVDRDEEGHAGSPTRLAPRTALCVAVCVIATGCAPQTVNQVTPPSPRQSDQQTAESPTGKPTWHYVVRLRDDSNQLSAQVCFDGFTPERLIPSIEGAQNLLRDAYIGQQRCAREDSAIIVDQPLVERCLRYTIDLDAAGTRGARDGALRVGADWILSPDVWMWIPEPRPEGVLPEVQFDLPAGVDVAVPWRPTGRQRFAVPESHFVWKSQGAVGRFHRQRHEVGGGALDVVLLGEWAHPSDVVQLVLRAAKTTTQVWGRLPSRRAQVLLVPRAKWRQPFGFALRGGGDSITLLLPHDFTTADIARDWAAVHELLHEMDPYAFEIMIAQLLDEMGYDDTEVTPRGNDKGVDVLATIEMGITTVKEVIQVKRFRANIQRPVLDALRGSLHRFRADRGTIITTGGFSKGTIDAAIEPGAAPITLIDGDRLVALLIEHGIGVHKRPVDLFELDASAFGSSAPDLDDEAAAEVGE